ncbi:MAG: SDR family NAD(P)-dependent oxidoreductase [Micrococcales bacterium]|nr:SDR family NAD(P)-dependent oxidoreductase [Micrococcales bacterium]
MPTGTPLDGSTVLVTGGGSGLGRLLAFGAAGRGAQVVVWDISADRAASTRDIILAHGGEASSASVDVSDRAAVEEAAAAAPPVDILINNAGVVGGRVLLDTTPEQITRVLTVNLHSLYWVTRAFLPGMVDRGSGSVVTVASAAALIGSAKMSDYAATKFGAFGFNEALRNEMRMARTGVNTMIVCPYYMSTGMFQGVKTRFSALLPILKPERIALKVLNGIESGKQQIIEPPFVRTVPLLRLLPVRVFDQVADLFGINQTMEDFTGREGDRV